MCVQRIFLVRFCYSTCCVYSSRFSELRTFDPREAKARKTEKREKQVKCATVCNLKSGWHWYICKRTRTNILMVSDGKTSISRLNCRKNKIADYTTAIDVAHILCWWKIFSSVILFFAVLLWCVLFESAGDSCWLFWGQIFSQI